MATAPKIIEFPAPLRNPGPPTASAFRRRSAPEAGSVPSERDDWTLNMVVTASLLRTIGRVFVIAGVCSYFLLKALFCRLTVRDKRRRVERYSSLLCGVFEALKGAFIKVGQYLSLRRDMLNVEYTEALKKLLDNAEVFPFAQAKQAIERQLGGPVESVFHDLDPEPIGKASIACVYQAWLYDKSRDEPVRVAIKVRRPGIVKLFAADLRALDWVMAALEYLTIFRKGVSRTFRAQLREVLLEELDFRKEARYQDLFRVRYEELRSYHLTAPRIYFQHSGEDIMVSEYIDAIPLTSITSAVEAGDAVYLDYLHSLNIDPVKIAKRLIRYNFHALFEDVFFHGDPHPGNILIRPNNNIVLIDFGACGTFSKRDRHLMLQMHHHHAHQDIRGMVQCVIALMEPLPPIEVDEFRRKLEKQYWDGYYGLLSKHSDWRDRTSYRLWVALFDLVREYQIPMPLNMLRMVRATLLYDTIAAQLFNKIDVFKEFRKYEATVASRLQWQFYRDATRQALQGPDLGWYLTFHRIKEMAGTALFRVQKFLDEPDYSFMALANKVYFAIEAIFGWLLTMATVSSLWAAALCWIYHIGVIAGQVSSRQISEGPPVNFLPTLMHFWNPLSWLAFASKAHYLMSVFFVAIATITFAHLNALRMRFNDPDL